MFPSADPKTRFFLCAAGEEKIAPPVAVTHIDFPEDNEMASTIPCWFPKITRSFNTSGVEIIFASELYRQRSFTNGYLLLTEKSGRADILSPWLPIEPWEFFFKDRRNTRLITSKLVIS